ncbi:hypothetical protein OfM1_11010 [Lactovum odontotermitis]
MKTHTFYLNIMLTYDILSLHAYNILNHKLNISASACANANKKESNEEYRTN